MGGISKEIPNSQRSEKKMRQPQVAVDEAVSVFLKQRIRLLDYAPNANTLVDLVLRVGLAETFGPSRLLIPTNSPQLSVLGWFGEVFGNGQFLNRWYSRPLGTPLFADKLRFDWESWEEFLKL